MGTSRDKIESSRDLSHEQEMDVLAEFLEAKPVKGAKQFVDLNSEVSPAILSGILGVNVQQIYQFRQDGKLPPNSDASLRECVKWHVTFYKTKAISKASSMGEAALIQKIKLDAAKTEQTWLSIRRERSELVSTKDLAEQFETHFIQLRMELCALARRQPAVQESIDKILASWNKIGSSMMEKSNKELDSFIKVKMEEDISIEETEESVGDSDAR